jgi:hypothetical protein
VCSDQNGRQTCINHPAFSALAHAFTPRTVLLLCHPSTAASAYQRQSSHPGPI